MCLLVCVYAHCVCRYPQSPEEGIGSPANGVTDGCKLPPCGCWELNTVPLQKQQELLATKPSFYLLVLLLGASAGRPMGILGTGFQIA